MIDNVQWLMSIGYSFHQAVMLENWRLWNDLQKAKEDKR